ncbi:MAG: 2-C-methyl-D-erythritol 4-phosphate cytidylyltransferase, partial [Ruminococcus sp.]|nr:2-C-methyl-D-erythritol 4-phosphate cytidylyltransferase [Ruminococcus sp.]
YAALVAGGSGTRMKNAPMPKQFLQLEGEAIITIALRTFYELEQIDQIYVGINPDWYDYTRELFVGCGFDMHRVKLVKGGADRNSTVMNILDSVKAEHDISQGDVILTHDAVRPFVSKQIILDNIACAKKFSACGTYIPTNDTIIRSLDGETVRENLVRSQLMRAQTPQSFELSALCSCIEKLGEDRVRELTDTCGIFTECGYPIHIVSGSEDNFKITTEFDLSIAKFLYNKYIKPL